jgi:acylphosphatase
MDAPFLTRQVAADHEEIGNSGKEGDRIAVSTANRQRREVLVSGNVQGVGFRFTTRAIAAKFAVTGFVRNLPDGRVQLVVEGEAGEIDAFVCAVRKEMQHYVVSAQKTDGPATGRFQSFEIKH